MKGGVTPWLVCTAVPEGGGFTGPTLGLVGPWGLISPPHAARSAPAIANAALVFRLGARILPADDCFEAMNNPDPDGKTGPDSRGVRKADPEAISPLEPGLYVVATPIGNLRDISLRALDILAAATRIYAEDTRVTRHLLDAYAIKAKLSAYHEHNAEAAREEILEALGNGSSVALVSDAGTPLVSDPGFKLARAAIEAGHKVVPVPGASACLAALVASGLPSDRFLFAGFTPSKSQARRAMFFELSDIRATLIFYETGPRLQESLADMAVVFGARNAVIARELTKMFEETRRDTLAALAAHYAEAGGPKGEIVVLVAPPPDAGEVDDEALNAFLAEALLTQSVKEAASAAQEELGVSRKRAYARALELKVRS
jgi:16S rRNA (cytidine1402-2'-O)-methyltransferase